MAKAFVGSCLVVLGVGLALAGCSPAPVMERLPTAMGGMPSGAPAAPRTGYSYPAVHDTPAPRATAPLTAEQQLELEKRLQDARQKQESQAGDMKDAQSGKTGGAK